MTQQKIQFSALSTELDNPFTNKLIHPTLDGVTVKFVDVTAELAELALANTPDWQRKRSPRTVECLATDMATGDFLFNGDTVRFGRDGEVIDGQHRLKAIVESGISQVMLWVEGLDKKVMAAIDTGRRRSYADLIGMAGDAKYNSVTAGIIGRYWYWLHGCYGRRGTARIEGALHTNAAPSYAQLNSIAASGKARGLNFVSAAVAARAAYPAAKIPPSVLGLAWILFSEIDVDAREIFFHELTKGAETGKHEYPINKLRDTALRRAGDDKNVPDWLWLHYILTTWNAWRVDKDLNTLKRPLTATPQSLAMPLGWTERA